MDSPKVSVIMGIYNCSKTLNEALDSLLLQTYQEFNVIMCDDGSTDNTYQIAEQYVLKYPEKFILIKNEENLGLNLTLNKCLSFATGKYIARMDGDDISLPTRFQKEVEFLDHNNNFSIVSTAMILFDDSGDWGIVEKIEKPQIKDFYKHNPLFCHAPCMIRKEAFTKVNGYSTDPRTLRCEDCHLWFKLYSKGYIGYNIQEPLYKMRDDHDAYKRRSFKARMNSVYVQYVGFKMLNAPFYMYIYVVRKFLKNFILGIIPEILYNYLHKRKQQKNNKRDKL